MEMPKGEQGSQGYLGPLGYIKGSYLEIRLNVKQETRYIYVLQSNVNSNKIRNYKCLLILISNFKLQTRYYTHDELHV